MNRDTRDLVSLLIDHKDHVALPFVIQRQFAGDDRGMTFCRVGGGKIPSDLILNLALAITDMEEVSHRLKPLAAAGTIGDLAAHFNL
jgi:hypothetical protein